MRAAGSMRRCGILTTMTDYGRAPQKRADGLCVLTFCSREMMLLAMRHSLLLAILFASELSGQLENFSDHPEGEFRALHNRQPMKVCKNTSLLLVVCSVEPIKQSHLRPRGWTFSWTFSLYRRDSVRYRNGSLLSYTHGLTWLDSHCISSTSTRIRRLCSRRCRTRGLGTC